MYGASMDLDEVRTALYMRSRSKSQDACWTCISAAVNARRPADPSFARRVPAICIFVDIVGVIVNLRQA